MKVLILTNTFPVKSERFILNHIKGLVSLGHAVTVLAKRAGEPNAADIPQNMDTLYYSSKKRKFLFFFIIKCCLFFLLFRPVSFFKIIGQIISHRDFSVLQIFFALRLLHGKDFDVTHAEFGFLGNMVLALQACKIKTGPLCVSFRGEDISSHVIRNPFLYKNVSKKGSLFLPVCESFRGILVKLGFPDKKILVYHSAIDLSLFPFIPRNKPGDKINLISIGRFVPKKGFILALEVLKHLTVCGLDASLELIGDGPEKENIRQKAEYLGIASRLRFSGWLDQHSVNEHLGNADVFLGVSITSNSGDTEGIPNVLKEAMSVGILVTAFNHSGVAELIQNKRTGFLIPEGDTRAMADCIVSILSGVYNIPEILKHARTLIEKEYSSEIQSKRIEALYHSLLKDEQCRKKEG
jgi:colanic acid/amylovoran biosynthesis glycosyltransferase